jgi:DmsE family decaheme c-type cytochrome
MFDALWRPVLIQGITRIAAFSALGLALLAACVDLSALRSDQPIRPVREYEKMIVGRLDANYIGSEACLAKCHQHDKISADLQQSVHGAQVSAASGLPLVNCESCHGPGSLAVDQLVEMPSGEKRCAFENLLPLQELPAQAQSLLCLKCHSVASTPNLQHWNAGTHANSDVSCFDCHNLHMGPQQKVSRQEMSALCYTCHQQVRMQFAQFSHHPVPEHKMACIDCHEPHGTSQENLLKGPTVKAMCTRCHMEYQGPFVYEHADVTENCVNCHTPHGSPNEPLLTAGQPFLCLQCHAGHHGRGSQSAQGALSSRDMKAALYSRCTDCHSSIHGTDVPSGHGRGSFIAR